MHLAAIIVRTWRPWSVEFGDALGDDDRVNSEMQLEAVIERDWRCTWRPYSSEFGYALGGCDRASLEMHLEAMIEQDWRSTWRQSIGGMPGAETLSIWYLTHNRGNVMRWLHLWALMESWLGRSILLGGTPEPEATFRGQLVIMRMNGRQTILGWMLYSVYAVLGVCCTRCKLYWVYGVLGECCTWC